LNQGDAHNGALWFSSRTLSAQVRKFTQLQRTARNDQISDTPIEASRIAIQNARSTAFEEQAQALTKAHKS
jgi:hypothetical protein